MNVVCIGGGPAGLYFALLLKKAVRSARVRVIERNHPGETFGWGVVFSDETLGNLRDADRVSYDEIVANFAHWDDIEIHFGGETIVSSGHGFCGIARKRLLQILQQRATGLGVELEFGRDVPSSEPYADADLIVASDGINSHIRAQFAASFRPDIERRNCRFVWLGTTLPLDAFTFFFEQTQYGWFTAHAYRFDATTSTFIVECREETWRAHGLDGADTAGTLAFCERLFVKQLRGNRLMANSAHLRGSDWINFIRVSNERWTHENIVLVGDAAHSAHFSVGSGTKLAMEDAIALQRALAYAKALGAGRAGVVETTFKEETETDLFGEQAVLCGGLTALIKAGYDTLVDAGYMPESAYFECVHELKLIIDLIYQGGLSYMRYSVSDTAEYGDYVSGPKVVDEHVRITMRQLLAEIQDGSFAQRWVSECDAGGENFRRMRDTERSSHIEDVGQNLRQMMSWLGEAAPTRGVGASSEPAKSAVGV